MIRRSSFVLFFSTALCGLSLHAADDFNTSLGDTPIKRQMAALPSTPAIEREAEEKFSQDVFSPDSASFFRELHVGKAKLERDSKKDQLEEQSRQKKLARELTFETERVEEENRRKIEELNVSIRLLNERLEQNQETRDQTEARVVALTQEIADLRRQEAELGERLSRELQAEKEKKKEVIVASRGTISDLESRLRDYRSKISELSTQLTVLTIDKGMQIASAEGLKKQIDLYKGLEEKLAGATTSQDLASAIVGDTDHPVEEPKKSESVEKVPTAETAGTAKQPARRRANFAGNDPQ